MSNESEIYFKNIKPKLLSFNLPIFDEFIDLISTGKNFMIFIQKLNTIVLRFNELLTEEIENENKEDDINFKILLQREEDLFSLLNKKEELIEELKNKLSILEEKKNNDKITMNEPLFKSKNFNKLFPQNKNDSKVKYKEFFKENSDNLIIKLQKENNEMEKILNKLTDILFENKIIKEKKIEFDKNNLYQLEEYFNLEKINKKKNFVLNFDYQKPKIKLLMEIINLSFSLKDFGNLLKNHNELKNGLNDIISIEKQDEELLNSNDKYFKTVLEQIEKNFININ